MRDTIDRYEGPLVVALMAAAVLIGGLIGRYVGLFPVLVMAVAMIGGSFIPLSKRKDSRH